MPHFCIDAYFLYEYALINSILYIYLKTRTNFAQMQGLYHLKNRVSDFVVWIFCIISITHFECFIYYTEKCQITCFEMGLWRVTGTDEEEHYFPSHTFKLCDLYKKPCIPSLTLKGPGGGGAESAPPSTFRAVISWKIFPAPRAFMTFFFQVLRNFCRYFRKNRAYGSKVTQHYVIERLLKIRKFSEFVYKTYGKWLLVPNLHFELYNAVFAVITVKINVLFIDIQYSNNSI